jgi:hypothetical protein
VSHRGGALSSRRHDLRGGLPEPDARTRSCRCKADSLDHGSWGQVSAAKLTKAGDIVSGRSAGGARLSPIKDRLSVRFGVAPGGGAILSRAKCQYICGQKCCSLLKVLLFGELTPAGRASCFLPLAAGEAQQLRLGQAAARYRESESLSLRQSTHLGHSFSCARHGPERRRMRRFPASCPNHEDRPGDPFRAVFRLSRPLSLTQPNHGHFGTDVGSAQTQGLRECLQGCGLERRPLRRSEPGSNCPV